ncbi:major facilitator superfamily domain-containing protein [Hyaloraphidium curvatum]|nr:major facilitator superfamily domain-containing protein [Hyaloraphidium curvatum]
MTSLNAATYVASTAFTVAFLVFLNATTGFVLSVVLGVPARELGGVAGTLGLADQLVAAPCVLLWGALSDALLPRRVVYGTGFFLIAASLFLYPNVPSPFPGLLLARCLFAAGASACTAMLSAFFPSFAGKASRGRLAGVVGLSTGLGALLSLFTFLRMPAWFGGENSRDAIRATYYVAATVAAVWASITLVGLRPGLDLASLPSVIRTGPEDHADADGHDSALPADAAEPESDEADPLLRGLGPVVRRSHDVLDAREAASPLDRAETASTAEEGPREKRLPFWDSAKLGIVAAKDPRVLLGYLGAVCARGDTLALTLFLPLFIARYYFSSGLCPKPDWDVHDPAEVRQLCRQAYLKASSTSGVAQLCALLTSLPWGWAADRAGRVPALLAAALVGVAGYGGMVFTVNPLAGTTYGYAALLGVAEAGLIVASLALIGDSEYVDKGARGSVAGMYSFAGSLGVLLTAKVGGTLFDAWGPGWAWAVGAVACAVCAGAALLVVALWRPTAKEEDGKTQEGEVDP